MSAAGDTVREALSLYVTRDDPALAALARLEAAVEQATRDEGEAWAQWNDMDTQMRKAEAQRDALAEALRLVDAEAEVARTDATGDIYEFSEDVMARVKDALAEAGLA